MMTTKELEELIKAISYRDTRVEVYPACSSSLRVAITFVVPPAHDVPKGSITMIRPAFDIRLEDLRNWDRDRVLLRVLDLIEEVENHERLEFFKVDGKHYIEPHTNTEPTFKGQVGPNKMSKVIEDSNNV